MSLENYIPAIILRLARGGNNSQGHIGNTNGEKYSKNAGANSTPKILKKLSSGNGAGHQKDNPLSYHPPHDHQRRPWYLERPKDNLEIWYFEPDKYLKNLLFINDKSRRKRSERREIIKVISQCLLHYVDMWSLRVGVWKKENGQFAPLSLNKLLKEINRNQPKDDHFSKRRLIRALKDLEAADYLKLTYRYITKNGKPYALPAIRELTEAFFIDLGITRATLDEQRHYRIQQLIKENLYISKEVKEVAENVLRRTNPNKHVSQFFAKAKSPLASSQPIVILKSDTERELEQKAADSPIKGYDDFSTWVKTAS